LKNQDLTLTLSFDQTPDEVFAAVMNVRGWWSQAVEGKSAAVGDQFTYRYKDVHRSTHRVTEAVPGERVVWHTVDADLSHGESRNEWTGTDVCFDIARKGKKTELRFTHAGLSPELECFDACSRGWGFFIGESLRELVATGEGRPDFKAKAAASR
jgi:hypothetical protein